MAKTNKIQNEDKLFKRALQIGSKMAEMQGYKLTEESASLSVKTKALYLFLVQVRQIAPLPEDKQDGQSLKKRIALWMYNALPEDDPLK